ncbi:hypothetical protein [Flavobacterium sp. XGLA_31]|uniref:hypothetical protein n=1 Tax=Flavobacterium sp. XGLA_31 TaxID=3447666 RepID=UPI003F400B17
MKKVFLLLAVCITTLSFFSCSNDTESGPMLIIKFKLDPNQVRLNNLGEPATIPDGNAAQTPIFNTIGSHYVELAPNANTQLGQGTVLYRGAETTAGGDNAIDFSKEKVVAEDEVFLKIPISQIAAGDYEWIRVSLAYQNYQISIHHQGTDYTGTLASFVGFNTYLTSFNIGNNIFPVNGNREQGYWAFALNDQPYSSSGQAPEGATTVPNPLHATSPIFSKSCVVTGKFSTALSITGHETKDINVTLSLSTNHSFEWHEVNADGKYEPSAGENVVDMGLRGLVPSYVK